MKPYLPIAAALLAVLNGILLLPSMSAYAFQVAVIALILAIVVFVLSLFANGTRLEPPIPVATPEAVEPLTPATVEPAAVPAPQAEPEIVAFFGILQEKGRLVDFLMDDVSAYDDAQVGAAARVVHQGCREVLLDYFKITPICQQPEGTRVTVPAGAAADEYRLLGKISGNPPFTGTLVHKGWKTESVKLPRVLKTDEKRLPSIAPAEVELG